MVRTVLIADDNALVRTIFTRIIRRICADVDIIDASSAQDALNACARCLPELVLLDHGLPDRSGFDVLRQLKHDQAAPYVIMITGNPLLQEEALAYGADDVWVKPIDVSDTLNHFAELLPSLA